MRGGSDPGSEFFAVAKKFFFVAADEMSGRDLPHGRLVYGIVMFGKGIVYETFSLFLVFGIGQRDCGEKGFRVRV